MTKKKIRDSEYFKGRLEREHPTIYKDLLSGKYRSINAAAAAAGLIHLPSRLDVLKRNWVKMPAPVRKDFVEWVKIYERGLTRRPPRPIAGPDGRLTSEVRTFISDWLLATKSRPAAILKDIKLSGYDWTLSSAVIRNTDIRKELIDALGPWLVRKGFR